MLYAATLLPRVRHLPQRWRWLLGFLLTDETLRSSTATTGSIRTHRSATGISSVRAYRCIQLAMLDIDRILFGAIFPQLQTLGLDFAMVATFIAIIVPQLFQMPHLVAALAAGMAAIC